MSCENSERSEWKMVKLLDVLEFIVDNRGKTVPTATLGIPLIATNCIKNDSLFPVFEKIRYVSEEIYSSWFRSHPKPGDIIFVNKGTPGRVCLVPNPVDFCIAQDMVALRADDKQIYPKYLFAVLRSPFIQQQIENMHVGTMIPHFKKGDFEKLSIPIPRREIQQFIGDCYFSLSMKIELNNRINKTLEEMAQAIFKQWFVDFDFPDENGQPYKSSGGKMEESELGLIPKGWKVGTIKDIAKDIICGKTPSTANKEYYGGDIPFITIPDMHGNVFVISTDRYLSKAGVDSQPNKTLPPFAICVSCIATPGLVVLTDRESQTNQQINSLICKEDISPYYVYLSLTQLADQIRTLGSGGSTTLNLNKTEFSKIKVIVPSKKETDKFHASVTSVFELIRNIQRENRKLSAIRDALLPRLMSGEIRVPIEEVQ